MRRRRRRFFFPLVAAVVLFCILAFFLCQLVLPPSLKGEIREVTIPSGTTFRGAVAILSGAGVLRSPALFSLMAHIKGVTRRVQAGVYALSTAMPPHVILQKIISGDVLKYRVTIPEGYTVRQIAWSLAEQGVIADAEGFVSLATSPALASSFGVRGKGLEGYLFPDTYIFPKGARAEDIIQAMVKRFKEVYTPEFSQRAAALGMTDHEVVILASIIEKETGIPEERPLISAVFHNRLRRGIPLCSDPTVIYGIPAFNGNLTRRDLKRPTPYNTYIKKGLPPGPIANPGRSSLTAALYPAPVSYLYFVSRNDGSHQFSTTLKAHNEAVWRYQKRGGR